MNVQTEDGIAKALRQGSISVTEALEVFDQGRVYVYAATIVNPDRATWEEVEDRGAGSGDLFSALGIAGATEQQMDQVGHDVEAARAEGRTIDSLWRKSSPAEGERCGE